MPLSGSNDRFDARSYAPYQADMQGGYAGEVCDGIRHRSWPDTIHHRQQTQAEGDLAEDGAEDSWPLEDEPWEIQAVGGEHLHEARTGVAVDVETGDFNM